MSDSRFQYNTDSGRFQRVYSLSEVIRNGWDERRYPNARYIVIDNSIAALSELVKTVKGKDGNEPTSGSLSQLKKGVETLHQRGDDMWCFNDKWENGRIIESIKAAMSEQQSTNALSRHKIMGIEAHLDTLTKCLDPPGMSRFLLREWAVELVEELEHKLQRSERSYSKIATEPPESAVDCLSSAVAAPGDDSQPQDTTPETRSKALCLRPAELELRGADAPGSNDEDRAIEPTGTESLGHFSKTSIDHSDDVVSDVPGNVSPREPNQSWVLMFPTMDASDSGAGNGTKPCSEHESDDGVNERTEVDSEDSEFAILEDPYSSWGSAVTVDLS